jgi:HEPN domain-containing protein
MKSRNPNVRHFRRVAYQRFAEATFLLVRGGFTTAAVYMAGYAVECMLKPMILHHENPARNPTTLGTFSGSLAHNLDWLRFELEQQRGITLPRDVAQKIDEIKKNWTTDLRYDETTMKRPVADALILWADGRVRDGSPEEEAR